MAKNKDKITEATPEEEALAETINELGEGHGPDARSVINQFSARLNDIQGVQNKLQRLYIP